MLFKYVFLAVAAAVGVSANMDHISHIMERQISSSEIPSACNSTCATALTIANACQNNDQATCLSVCTQSNFQSFTACIQCIVNDTPGITSSDLSTLQQALSQLATLCQAASSSVSVPTLTGGSGSASGSASASDSVALSSLQSISAAASSVISNSAASASGGATSATSAAAASGSSAAASSKSAGGMAAVVPQGALTAALIGLVGVVAGAAWVF